MARSLCIFNMKGGVGKTTITTTLAHYLAISPKENRVLVVDLDVQNNTTQYLLGIDAYRRMMNQNAKTVVDIFEQDSPLLYTKDKHLNADQVIKKARSYNNYNPSINHIHLIPSRIELMKVVKNPHNKEKQLKDFLEKVNNQYDWILIDCPPLDSILTESAFHASKFICVPVTPEFLPVMGLPLVLESLKGFKNLNPESSLKIVGIVINKFGGYFPEEQESYREIQEYASRENLKIFDTKIRFSRSFPKSARESEALFNTPRVRQTVRENFANFVRELKEAWT